MSATVLAQVIAATPGSTVTGETVDQNTYALSFRDRPMNKLEEWWATEGINLSHKDACIAAFKLGLSVHAATETSRCC